MEQLSDNDSLKDDRITERNTDGLQILKERIAYCGIEIL